MQKGYHTFRVWAAEALAELDPRGALDVEGRDKEEALQEALTRLKQGQRIGKVELLPDEVREYEVAAGMRPGMVLMTTTVMAKSEREAVTIVDAEISMGLTSLPPFVEVLGASPVSV